MKFFIDESGTFGKGNGPVSLSVVGALVVPDYRWGVIQRKYQALRARLPKEGGEVKGRLLAERDVSRILDLLFKNQCIIELVATDLANQQIEGIKDHQRRQALAITKELGDQHEEPVRSYYTALRQELDRLPTQLYVQSVLMFELVSHALQSGSMYFSQRQPKELACFQWVVDAKDRGKVTNWEIWWRRVLIPFLLARSVESPLAMLPAGDYRYFERFHGPLPEWLASRLSRREGSLAAANIGLLLEDFRVASDPEPGLELVDIVVNCARRALVGNLAPEGYRLLPKAMIHVRTQYIHLVRLDGTKKPTGPSAYYSVLNRHFRRGGREMIAPRFRGNDAAFDTANDV